MPHTFPRVLLALSLALLAACDTSAPAEPRPAPAASESPVSTAVPAPTATVAFIQDLSPEGSSEVTLPALQAIELAFLSAALEADPVLLDVVTFDTQGDPATAEEVAATIVGDPSFVAAVVAPGLPAQAAVGEPLASAGVPVVSLSARGAVADPAPGTWLRLVAPIEAQARALIEGVDGMGSSRRGVCVVPAEPDGTTFARDVGRLLARSRTVVEIDDLDALSTAGCGVVVWAGGPEAGAAIAAALGPRQRLVGGPALLNPAFLELAGPAAEGATAFCSCADVSTSLDLAAQRFIQDYQSEYGSAPGPYAVEGWDAAHLLVRAVREGAPTRAGVVSSLAATGSEDGLGGSYVFTDGELAHPEAATRRFLVEGGRWIEAPRPA
jgi:branched-chain amino acid transport system substrate-binding protein